MQKKKSNEESEISAQTVRIPVAKMKDLSHLLVELDMGFQSFMMQFIDRELASAGKDSVSMRASTPPALIKRHPAQVLLDDLLAHGTPEEIRKATAMLEICAPAALPVRPAKRGRTGG